MVLGREWDGGASLKFLKKGPEAWFGKGYEKKLNGNRWRLKQCPCNIPAIKKQTDELKIIVFRQSCKQISIRNIIKSIIE